VQKAVHSSSLRAKALGMKAAFNFHDDLRLKSTGVKTQRKEVFSRERLSAGFCQ
jgi:hypothetical protein